MELGIVIPLIILPIVIVAVFVWYRRSMAALRPDGDKPISGVRLTAESLHRLESPPWRVVYEIGGTLGGVDHVVIGAPGVIAISTAVADRPHPEELLDQSGTPSLVSDAAVARGPVDELVRPAGVECRVTARVFWGSPAPGRPPADELVHGCQLVEGQRLGEWLVSMRPDDALLQPQIDRAWQAIVMGIGRPDPLSGRR